MAATEIPAPVPAPTAAVPVDHGWPVEYDVLILDAATRQSLACARSLGRAGLRVAMGECFAECDPALPVLGFRSRYSARNVVLPSFAANPEAFADGIADFVREHRTRVLLPAMDGSIAALMSRRKQLETLGCHVALPANPVLELANDKDRTLAVARGLGIDLPKTMRISAPGDVPAVLAEFPFPFVLKPAVSWAPQSHRRLQGREVVDRAEAVTVARDFLDAGVSVLAQEWAGGRREGVTLFLLGDDVLASFAHLEHRTSPPLGGVSVLREGVPMPADLYEPSVRLAAAVGLQGLCEVEFRRDSAGRPLLMEINARLAGPVGTALKSGVNFPLMVWQWATGQPVDRIDGYRSGYRSRWLRGDMRWLRDNYQQAGRPDGMLPREALWTFITEFTRTFHYDCLDRDDLRPALAEFRTTAAAVLRSRSAPVPHPDARMKG